MMEELMKLLDKNLEYERHEINGKELHIYVRSTRCRALCSYCGNESEKVHSRKERTLKDLPMQGKKVKIKLEQKKYFCGNENCGNKTFTERFAFIEARATRTKRLEAEIMRVALTQSSVSASRYLRNSVTDVSKSTICDMLKKSRSC